VASREPSVSSLADSLTRSDAPASAPEPRVAIARPSLLVRALIAGILVLGLVFLAAVLVLGARVSTLVVEMRADRDAREHRARAALPAEEVLRDHELTRRETLARPLAASRIWQARCELLAKAADWQAIDATCTAVALVAPGDLDARSRVWWAEAQYRLSRHAEASRTLHGLDLSGTDPGVGARAAELAARIWQAQAPPRRSVEGPAEQTGQPASE
jgi:hypothetical protein